MAADAPGARAHRQARRARLRFLRAWPVGLKPWPAADDYLLMWFPARERYADDAGPGGRILVVEDHELILKLLERVLELEGHHVRCVESLAAAERELVREAPDLIVLDLHLPDGDGLELARRVKADPPTARCPIVACTAGALDNDCERALAAGCAAYVSKPIDIRGFAELVAGLLPGRSATSPR